MNYERLNTFVDRYEEKMDQESNTTNDERLQKSLAENANDYIRRSEIGSGLLQGASVVYHSKDYIDKAKDTFETIKRLPKDLEEKVNKLRQQAEEGIDTAKDAIDTARDTARDTVDRVRGTVDQMRSNLKDSVDNARQDITQTVQDGVDNARQDITQTVQDGVDRVQSQPVVDWTTGTMRDMEEEEQEEIQPRRTVQQEQFDETKIKPRSGLANEDTGEIPSYFRVTEPPETPMEAKIRRLRGRPDQTNTEQLNQEINTSNEAENTSKSLVKTGSKLAAEEEGIGEAGEAVEEASGGLLSEVVVPLVSVAMVGTAIADLFHNKPKETKLQAPNPLFVPKNFTLDKQALVSSSQLPR